MFSPEQKRLLALDGGGIMGLISLQILKEMEDQLASKVCKPRQFSPAGISSTISAAHRRAQLSEPRWRSAGRSGRSSISTSVPAPECSSLAYIWQWLRHKFDCEPLALMLRKEIGEETVLDLQRRGKLSETKHLLIVTQNISSDSPWPISTNPKAKYNDEAFEECNRRVPLWQWVRASTAAPTYFPPQAIALRPGDRASIRKFEDGGVTSYNNPAFLLYRMATLPEYRCAWRDGESTMMLVSVGDGFVAVPEPHVNARGRLLSTNARQVASGLMQRISTENDILCRTVGRCAFGAEIDREIGSLAYPLYAGTTDLGRRFLYARYDPDVSDTGLIQMGLGHLTGRRLAMDDVSQIEVFSAIGRAYAECGRPSTFRPLLTYAGRRCAVAAHADHDFECFRDCARSWRVSRCMTCPPRARTSWTKAPVPPGLPISAPSHNARCSTCLPWRCARASISLLQAPKGSGSCSPSRMMRFSGRRRCHSASKRASQSPVAAPEIERRRKASTLKGSTRIVGSPLAVQASWNRMSPPRAPLAMPMPVPKRALKAVICASIAFAANGSSDGGKRGRRRFGASVI